MQPILKTEQLAKLHPTGERPFLFSEVDIEVFPQNSIALVGASGQGKSTLLRMLARLEQADGGAMLLHGVPSGQWAPTEWRKRISYVPQAPVVLPTTVEDNLATVSKLHRTEFDRELARRCMEAVGLGHIGWSKNAAELSGGERQRLQLVRSLLLRAEIYLLDEVTSSLDTESKDMVERLLLHWCDSEGTAFIWITHDPEQASKIGKRTWQLAGGKLHEVSAPAAEDVK
ncbi:ABC transporter ATP-binding protein [Gordoniibacillus kamchatkensis]|uniref:ABC transporter ATP-binding protein n=1 Tax=Gordoniibacillus kamchatkensis TaxID=1590651 RepID=UPI001E5972C1|nr:ATP-binding cassette domain-containing protein [Paenibacillus sp. VKM B-2647]